MFLLRPIWAVVHALVAKRADLVVENLALPRGAGFNVPVHHSTSRDSSSGPGLATQASRLNKQRDCSTSCFSGPPKLGFSPRSSLSIQGQE